jgi:hypothetical protein
MNDAVAFRAQLPPPINLALRVGGRGSENVIALQSGGLVNGRPDILHPRIAPQVGVAYPGLTGAHLAEDRERVDTGDANQNDQSAKPNGEQPALTAKCCGKWHSFTSLPNLRDVEIPSAGDCSERYDAVRQIAGPFRQVRAKRLRRAGAGADRTGLAAESPGSHYRRALTFFMPRA